MYFYNSEELVEPVPTPTGTLLWQSLPRLAEALQEAIAKGRAAHPHDVTMTKDIGGYVEKVPVAFHAPT